MKERLLQPSKMKNNKFESLTRLIQIMRNDEVINKKITAVLQMDSNQRRSVLNNWMEMLQRQDAPKNLLSALSCLFDDKVSEQVLTLINNRKI